MKILFVHDNYPAQFGTIGAYLARQGWDVRFATAWEGATEQPKRFLHYKAHRDPTEGIHPYAIPLERAVIKGQSAARAFVSARNGGYQPDIIMAHTGWGSGTFARDVWPSAKFVSYVEWWYNYPAPDTMSLGEHKDNLHNHLLQRARNAPIALDLAGADLAFCPTGYQASQFPANFREGLTVMHDGVDIALHAPADVRPTKVAGLDLSAMDEIVTFITRGMEPHRGFPQFMRALAALQARRPDMHAIIGGQDRVAYGRQLPDGDSWKARMLDELSGKLDLNRIHFIGLQPRGEYVRVLQASQAHVYLTADFVLSWSMMDAMAVGCPMIVSDCPPVNEFMTDGETGLMVPFADHKALANRVEEALDDPDRMFRLGAAARGVIVSDYDAADIYQRKEVMLRALL